MSEMLVPNSEKLYLDAGAGDGLTPLEAGEAAQPATPATIPDPLFHAVVMFISAGVLALAFLLSVRGETQVLVPVLRQPLPELCMTRRMMDISCPGCGMTRCFISIAHGDFRGAWSYNPAGLLFFAVVAFQIPYRALQLWRIQRGLPELWIGRLAQVSLGIVATAMIGQWLLRLCGVSF